MPSSTAEFLPSLQIAIARVPPGSWGVAVSGGADSVALLSLLLDRQKEFEPLTLLVLHLDHQTRAGQSTEDASFVARLCQQWNVPSIIATLDEIESANHPAPPPSANPSERYRIARLNFFRREAAAHRLDGIILAHHAADWAETILHRLMRASPRLPSPSGLVALRPVTTLGNLKILRPLLEVYPLALRSYLIDRAIPWREDSSNKSPRYLRNRLRKLLIPRPRLAATLRELSAACASLHDWIDRSAPVLPDIFYAEPLATLPRPLAECSARRWLQSRGCPPARIDSKAIALLLRMVMDAASPPQSQFPGRVLVQRRRGIIQAKQANKLRHDSPVSK